MRACRSFVYSAAWCRDCRQAKRFLEEHQIAYTEIDIERVPGAAEEVYAPRGQTRHPAVRHRWQVGAAVSPRPRLSLSGDERAAGAALLKTRFVDVAHPSVPGSFRIARASPSSAALTCSDTPSSPFP